MSSSSHVSMSLESELWIKLIVDGPATGCGRIYDGVVFTVDFLDLLTPAMGTFPFFVPFDGVRYFL